MEGRLPLPEILEIRIRISYSLFENSRRRPFPPPATHISIRLGVAGRGRRPEQTQKLRGHAFSDKQLADI